jgi:hypothetical protein
MITPAIKKYMLAICMLMISAAAIQAQQRPSEKPMASDIQKINAKRAERIAYIRRSQQATPTKATTTPSIPAPVSNTKPVSNNNTLPSQSPLQRPVKPNIRKLTVPADTTGRRPG